MSSTVCADHQLRHMKKTPFKDVEIPPRKLLFSPPNDAVSRLCKYLPCDDDDSDGSNSDPYATDHFRMYEFKVRRCTRSRSHDWTDCPFAHPGEKARRRDPRRFRYCSTVCSEFRRGIGCSRGNDCEFAHGVFECWLHPTRYRTEACKDGKNCKRKVCFFAHSPRELRILSDISAKCKNSGADHCSPPVSNNSTAHCCLFCHSVSSPSASSPTSTLLGLSHFSRSPSLSPPMSPVKQLRAAAGFSPSKLGSEAMSYKDMVSELVRSLEGMGMGQEVCSPGGGSGLNLALLDLCFHGDHHSHGEEQRQAVLPPEYCTQMPVSGSGESFEILGTDYNHDREDCWHEMKSYGNEKGLGSCGGGDPDLGWVNDLLM